MNPPERHLAAVPDATRDGQRRGKSKSIEDARATADKVRDFPGTPAVPGPELEKILADSRAAAREDQAAVDWLRAVLEDGSVAGQRQAMFERGEAARKALAKAKAPRPAGPFAQVHTEGYRRGGKRRKRELAAYRQLNEPGLRLERASFRGGRRAARTGRA